MHDLRGHRLPMRSARRDAGAGRALLVGDAAGLIDPLSGDGMYEAFVSARLAAEAVLDLLAGRARDLGPYARGLDRELRTLTAACWGAKIAFDRFPRITYAITSLPRVWDAFETLTCGEIAAPRRDPRPGPRAAAVRRGTRARCRRSGPRVSHRRLKPRPDGAD